MPTKCSVSNCENYYSKGAPFYDVPSPLRYKFCSEKAELTKKRRNLWLNALGITDDTSEILRICSKHFVTEKPAALEDSKNIDWVPTLHIESSSSRRKHRNEGFTTKRRNATKMSYRPKENDNESKYNQSNKRRRENIGKAQDKVKNEESKRGRKNYNLKKYLNCKVVMTRNVQSTTFKGTNGSGLTIAQEHGYFTGDNVTVKETAINNAVLRVRLLRQNLNELKMKYKLFRNRSKNKRKRLEKSSFGREIKKKNYFLEHGLELRSNTEKKYSMPETRQTRSREFKTEGIGNKFQQKYENKKSDDSKTLNRSIKRVFRDKIKIKLFPKSSRENLRRVRNAPITYDNKSQLQRGFVKRYNNNSQEDSLYRIYYLKFNNYLDPEEGTLDYSFQKLVTDVKHMKLPAPSWKIKVIIKQGKINAITFTNKSSLERSVGFSANSNKYRITIDNKAALLLGSPNHVQTSTDLEILLDIVQNIDSKNPMLFYK